MQLSRNDLKQKPAHILHGDCVQLPLETNSVDLTVFSPPYEAARKYAELSFKLSGQDWVDWMFSRFMEAARVTRGIVACVVNGRTRDYEWSCVPALLLADLKRKSGLHVRKPLIFHRDGIAGSGGPDWFRDCYEFILCASKHPGPLDTISNTAMGKPPKYAPGGNPTHRTASDKRVQGREYKPPAIANPGNVIRCSVGGGHMGHDLAHENEAPFPEELADWLIRSMSPEGGVVLDIMAGSGTSVVSAHKAARIGVGIDVRMSQCGLMCRRLKEQCGLDTGFTSFGEGSEMVEASLRLGIHNPDGTLTNRYREAS